MFNEKKLLSILSAYKQHFPKHWKDEKYKWEAVQHFQNYWNIYAEDFCAMFMEATEQTSTLLTSVNNYPRNMIKAFASVNAEAVRGMFQQLYDESRNFGRRITQFMETSEMLRTTYDDGTWKLHYQTPNVITTYLWLRYPDKYYIYKYAEVRAFAKAIDSDFIPKKGNVIYNIEGTRKFYNEIRTVILQDAVLDKMLKECIENTCYPDLEKITMTMDVSSFASRYYEQKAEEFENVWFPLDYSPGLTVADWMELLQNREIFDENSLQIMKCMLEYGGEATCTQLAEKYGGDRNFYNKGSSALGKRIAVKTGCPLMEREDTEGVRYWTVLYIGRNAEKEQPGSFVWKLREELKAALLQTDLSGVPLYFSAEKARLDRAANSIIKVQSELPNHTATYTVKAQSEPLVTSTDILQSNQTTNVTMKISPEQSKPENIDTKTTLEQAEVNAIQPEQLSNSRQIMSPEQASVNIRTMQKEQTTDSTLIKPIKHTDSSSFTEYDKLQSNARFKKWMNPIVVALRELGGSANVQDTHNKIIELYNISEEELSQVNQSGNSCVLNDMDWARNYLNYEGILDNTSARGTWTLSALGEKIVISDQLAGMIIAKWIRILAARRENKPIPEINLEPFYQYLQGTSVVNEPYTKAEFLSEVYMTEDKYHILVSLLRRKKNLILQGAPGVGKTFAAKRLAYSIMGEKDDTRIAFVQFHQSYSYEDFILGYKPQGEGFALTEGVFYRFCIKAQKHPDKDYFFIIDEINRGNMSKIFGELLMLIEKDYRGSETVLAYGATPFSVPENLYLIGMMNTADRSLAMIDYALRRRFSFFEMEPSFDAKGFQAYQESLHNETFNALIKQIIRLNNEIQEDDSLGEGFRIGHSYFCGQENCTKEWMQSVVYYDIIPMLEEYWFDNKQKVQKWKDNLSGVFDDER
ncbi:MAG: AAA family ATPase [Lachnospiraceae bacterium]|nr:AAA family ATPase [Lachnospiraceae bacterium]